MSKLDKTAIFKFLKRLNKELLNKFTQMKTQFEKSPPPPNEIKKRFIDWKSKYDQIVFSTLKEFQDIDEKNFDFKDFIVKMNEEFGSDQQFLELLRGVNSSIEMLKDYIRVNLIRDPTIFEVRQTVV